MATESDPKPIRSPDKPKKSRGKAKYIALVGVAFIVFLAAQTGFLGFGLAHLRAATFPKDESLLEYVPASAGGVLILDPHQVALKELGAEGGTVRQYLDRTREQIKKATSIDLIFDVDKLVLSPALVVARGRFNERKVAERLAEHGYIQAEYKGVKYELRAGEDAIAILDGDLLLYGTEAEIRAGIDAKETKSSIGSHDEATARLAQVGWNHPILGAVQLVDTKPSVRSILVGSTGPRAITIGVATKGGLVATVAIEAASPDAAEELRKLIEGKRADAEALKTLAGPEIGAPLAEIAKRATLAVEPGTSRLILRSDVRQEELDALVKASSKASASFAEAYKSVRLFQLLAP